MQLLLINLEKVDGTLCLKFGECEEFYSEDAENDKTTGIVTINRGNFDPEGKSRYKLCGINSMNELVEKTGTVSEALFHELCHAFHKYSGIEMNECDLLDYVYEEKPNLKYLWTGNKSKDLNDFEDDEEMYTITGCHYAGSTKARKFDLFSCNMFSICANISKPEEIIQRVFHYSYGAYKEYLISYVLSESEALYNIKKFLIDINEFTLKTPQIISDKIMEPVKK
jgi:hypothetical protein